VHPDSTQNIVAVGTADNSLRVYKDHKLIYNKKLGAAKSKVKEWVQDMKFSPDGKYLCVGSHDNYFYLYDLANGIENMKGVRHGKSSSFISHLDWSADSSTIRTVDGSYELLFYTMPGGQ